MKFDQEKALKILGMNKPKSTCERFTMTLSQLENLVINGLIERDDCQNDSPSIEAFLEFCFGNDVGAEEVKFEAYIIVDRDDARVSVEGILLDPSLASESCKQNFLDSFRNADEFSFDLSGSEYFRAWWD
jgi:hypothetical protein